MKSKIVIITFIAALFGGFFSLIAYHYFFEERQMPLLANVEQPITKVVHQTQLAGNLDLTIAAEKAVHSVVHIKTSYQSQQNSPFYQYFYGGRPMPVIGSGSGVIISSDGYIVTNNHVVSNSNNIEVILNDKRSFKAKIIGKDPTSDLALLKIDANNLQAITFGNSDNLKVGEWVLAVGNPFNLTSTVTAGIVSAKARNINIMQDAYSIESFIQTDAAVNPGNSGGALVNVAGELVGINAAIATKTGSYSGYSFAIPVSLVQKVVADLKEYGIVQRALLGVSIMDINANTAKEFNLNKIEGVYIQEALQDGAANKAGLRKGDVVLKIENVPVNKTSELQELVSRHRPGDKIILTYKRNGNIKKVSVLLQNKQGNTKIIKSDIQSVLGASFIKLSDKEKSKIGLSSGVKVTELYPGKLMKAGVRKGYIIININRIPINNIEDVERAVKNANGGVYIKGIYPNGIIEYYAFGLD